MEEINHFRFIAYRSESIRNLDTFQKNHRVPKEYSPANERFIQSLVEPLLDEELQTMFGALRKAYGLKRKEISVSGPSEGEGIVVLPFFKYRIVASLNEDDLSRVAFSRIVEDISEPARILAPPFEAAIPFPFTTLELTLKSNLDLEAIVDTIEDAEAPRIELEYDKDLTWCELNLLDRAAAVRLDHESIQVRGPRELPASTLLETFANVQRFISNLELLPLAFDQS